MARLPRSPHRSDSGKNQGDLIRHKRDAGMPVHDPYATCARSESPGQVRIETFAARVGGSVATVEWAREVAGHRAA